VKESGRIQVWNSFLLRNLSKEIYCINQRLSLQEAKILLQNIHTHFIPSVMCVGVYSSRNYTTKSFALSAPLETQERYFLSTRKGIKLLPASTHNYLTYLMCYEVNCLFRSMLLNSLYNILKYFKNNTWAIYSIFWRKVSCMLTVEIMMGIRLSTQTISTRENIASYISKASVIQRYI